MNPRAPNPLVLIPVYKTNLNSYEWISVQRAFAVFNTHPIALLAPQSRQEDVARTFQHLVNGHFRATIEPIDDHWLDSVRSYNQLCLDRGFYQRFSQFSHLLIYQLDAYALSDQLMDWCQQELDYIGAPIYPSGVPYGAEHAQCVGAGGLSLRRTEAFLKALQINPVVFRTTDFLALTAHWGFKARLLRGMRCAVCFALRGNRLASSTNQLFQWAGINEDVLYGKYAPKYLPWFRVPSYDQARMFCIDRHVQQELIAMEGRLPFGAHGWWTSEENLVAWSEATGLIPSDSMRLQP